MRTIVDLMNVTKTGAVEVRLKKFDGATHKVMRRNGAGVMEEIDVENFRYHRLVITPGEDAAARIADVNGHIQHLSENADYVSKYGRHAPCPQEEIERIKSVCLAAHTPEKVSTYRALGESVT